MRAKPGYYGAERIGEKLGTEPTSLYQNTVFRSMILPKSYARFYTCISPGKEFVTFLRFSGGFLTPETSELLHC